MNKAKEDLNKIVMQSKEEEQHMHLNEKLSVETEKIGMKRKIAAAIIAMTMIISVVSTFASITFIPLFS